MAVVSRLRSACLLASLLVAAARARAAEDPSGAYLKRAVAQLISLHSDGLAVGYSKFRHIQYGPLFSEHGRDAVVLFNLEGFMGGNQHVEYLAIFEKIGRFRAGRRRSQPYRLIATLEIGAREWRSFDRESLQISHGRLSLSGKAWAPGDPGCCPSEPISTSFRVGEGRVVEELREP